MATRGGSDGSISFLDVDESGAVASRSRKGKKRGKRRVEVTEGEKEGGKR